MLGFLRVQLSHCSSPTSSRLCRIAATGCLLAFLLGWLLGLVDERFRHGEVSIVAFRVFGGWLVTAAAPVSIATQCDTSRKIPVVSINNCGFPQNARADFCGAL